MKKALKIISVLMLLALSEFLKLKSVESVLNESMYELVDFEQLNYALNALLIFMLFYALSGHIKHLAWKLTGAVGATVLFASQLIAENSFLLYLQVNSLFDWVDPASYWDAVLYGLNRYFLFYVPKYHIVLPAFLLLTSAAALYIHYKPRLLKKMEEA